MSNYLLVILGVFTSAMAQIMLKRSGEFTVLKDVNFFIYLVLGGLFYVASFGLYVYLLRTFNLSKISPIMTIATMILVVVAGILFFKEVISTKQALGIVFGLISIMLIVGQ